MPVNKNSLRRYRIEDRLLSDPNYDYTTDMILRKVNAEMSDEDKVEIRMIQKDIIALQDDFGKEMVRGEGGRGTVRYKDQSSPLFYQQLTDDEEAILREVLKTLGQFNGLDNFTWLDLLKKKLDMSGDTQERPIISFSRNDGLQIPETLLGRLFTAISRKQVIRVTYKKFNGSPKEYDLYPYQLKQYNDRWFLLSTPLEDDVHPYDPNFIITLALDRMIDFTYVDDRGPYLETPVDLETMYEEVVGVTVDSRHPDPEDILFAVKPESVNYIRTKWIHSSQMEITGESEKYIKECYPSLKDCTIFSVCCRMNSELLQKFLSYGDKLIVFDDPNVVRSGEWTTVAPSIMQMAKKMADNYSGLSNDIEKICKAPK